MTENVIVTTEELHELATSVLVAHNTSKTNAVKVADALVAAEIDGQRGHGASRLSSYSAQSKSGKIDGQIAPTARQVGSAAWRVDACSGFAFPAVDLAIDKLVESASGAGIAMAGIHNSHHFGQAGYHVEKLADKGLIGLAFSNSPKAIAPWGGKNGVFGTNPIAFAAPRQKHPPLVIDLSLSKVARGKIMVASKKDQPIPEGWALDPDGNPTTDANAALEGTMLPMGDAKGTALVLLVEILAAALTSSHFGFEASSFFTADGPSPGVGQFLIAIDPSPISGNGFAERLECLIEAILSQEGVRLPGDRKFGARKAAIENGLQLPRDLYEELQMLRSIE
ncbi:MAG: Ldh family oxidoreductase [Pseudomonadota bacterium]